MLFAGGPFAGGPFAGGHLQGAICKGIVCRGPFVVLNLLVTVGLRLELVTGGLSKAQAALFFAFGSNHSSSP